MDPGNYAGGALVTSQLAIALGIIFPNWSATQDGAIAGLAVAAVGAGHLFVKWYITWKFPDAPPLPMERLNDVPRPPVDH
jgi:hypothetical protein